MILPINPSMTRLKLQALVEKEAKLQEAVATIWNKQHMCHSATLAFKVPCQTLYNCVKGKPLCNKAHEADQLLSYSEEKELVQWIMLLTLTGYPSEYVTLNEI